MLETIALNMKIYSKKDADEYEGSADVIKEKMKDLGISIPQDDELQPPPPYLICKIKICPQDIYYYMESYSPEEMYDKRGFPEAIQFDCTTIKLTSGEEISVQHTMSEFEQMLEDFEKKLSKPKRKSTHKAKSGDIL